MVIDSFKTKNNNCYNVTFDGLVPNTEYSFRLHIIYNLSYDVYTWPKLDSDVKFVFKTLSK